LKKKKHFLKIIQHFACHPLDGSTSLGQKPFARMTFGRQTRHTKRLAEQFTSNLVSAKCQVGQMIIDRKA